jgi:hypothetical protein
MFDRIAVLRALIRKTERVFNPDPKGHHWGRRNSDRLVMMPPRRRVVVPSVVVSANTKIRKMGLMVPFVAPECGRMSQ